MAGSSGTKPGQASRHWPSDGVPQRLRTWLTTVAAWALIDGWRADSARRRREAAAALDPAGPTATGGSDGTLTLLFVCCHPALPPRSQLALTLRAVGGLITAQVAAGFLVPEGTIAKRINRAKEHIREAGARFDPPDPAQRDERLRVVRHVLYLMFTEGHTASAAQGHRLNAVRVHLLEQAGDLDSARAAYRRAARATASQPEQRYLSPQSRPPRDRRRTGRAVMTVQFTGRIRRFHEDKPGGLAVVDIPAALVAELGGRRQMRVTGTLNDAPFTGSTMLVAGGGLCVAVSKANLKNADAALGDEVRLAIERAATSGT